MVGIPRQVDVKHLEAKVLSIFQKVGCNIAPEFIDDCHRLGKNNDRERLAITYLDDLAINFPGVYLSQSPKASLWRTNGCCVQLLYSLVFWYIFCYLFSFCMFYQKIYDKLGYALFTFPQFFSKSISIGSLSLIE